MGDALKELLLRLVSGQRNPVGQKNLIREYLQARILQSVVSAGAFRDWAFTGGTALRFLYDLPRFSEDLDFVLTGREDRIRDVSKRVQRSLSAENYAIEVKLQTSKTVLSVLFRFPGLYHELGVSADPRQKLTVKLELDTRPPSGYVLETTLVRRHVTLSLTHHDKASLLAGKLNAILTRHYLKGRDLYDLVWYLSDPRWPPPNSRLLQNALDQFDWHGPYPLETDWKALIWERLETEDIEAAVTDVAPFLESPDDEALIRRENLRKLLTG